MLDIKEINGVKCVELSELYAKLELLPQNYAKFIKAQIVNSLYAKPGIEYSYLGKKTSDKGGRPKDEYIVTLDFAKELIILSKSKVGKRFRDWLISISAQVENRELHTDDQVVYLVKLKEIFKYVCYQKDIEEKHKVTFVEQSHKKNAYAEFNIWRNSMLNLDPSVLNERIKQYCIENGKRIKANSTKRDQLLMLDKYETIRNAVWDFLQLKGEVNSMRLANLVKRMAEAEGAQLFRTNEDDLFRQKEQLVLPSVLQKQLQ